MHLARQKIPASARTAFVPGLFLAAGLAFLPGAARAQFLRLGPFNFMADDSLRLIYTTNVEGERKSQATKSRQDVYLENSFKLNGTTYISPATDLTLDTGFTVTKHFIRTDLDGDQNPSTTIQLSSSTAFSHYTVNGNAGFQTTTMTAQDVFVPGDRKNRDDNNRGNAGVGVTWQRAPLGASANYSYTAERHLQSEFKDGDQNQQKYGFKADWAVLSYASLFYSMDRTDTIILQSGATDGQTTEKFGLDGRIPLTFLRRPKVYYEFGVESKHGKDDPESSKWKPMHTITVEDEWDLSSTIHLKADAQYANKILEDDVGFTYGAQIQQEIGRTANQTLSATREPVRTFGSTKKTDQTTFNYGFTKSDLFIYNLNFTFNVNYTISTPLDQGNVPTEKKWTYSPGLSYQRTLSRKLSRSLAYVYKLDVSNLEQENVDEHRVTLTYTYTF